MVQLYTDAMRLAGEAARAAAPVVACAVTFAGLAIAIKGRRALAEFRSLAPELRITAAIAILNRLTVGPLAALAVAFIATGLRDRLPHLPGPQIWGRIGDPATLITALFLGDLAGYWRHRLQHTRFLWPFHAVHHGDPRLCWFSLERMHPIDELGALIDSFVLGLLGFPFWALAANTAIRHYWGYFIHADLPWTLGKAGLVLSSPAMHRWHHSRDVAGFNFATIFSVFDRLFGTYYVPGPCGAPTGVKEDVGQDALAQLLHPFRAWARPAAAPDAETA